MAKETDENTEVVPLIDGSGPSGEFQEGDDLASEVVETLADYLHCLSKDPKNGNRFQIAPGVEKVSTQDANGDPAPLDDNAKGSSNPFAPTSQNQILSQYSDSGKFGSEAPTKGKSDTYLLEMERVDQGAPKAVVTSLEGNRFSPGPRRGSFAGRNNITTIDNGSDAGKSKEISVIGSTQRLLGANDQSEGPLNKQVSMEELKKIGASLMLRAAREIGPVQSGDPDSASVGFGALIPGATQIAITKVHTNALRAKTVAEENFGYPRVQGADSDDVTEQGTMSWGHLNTPLEPYAGFLPIGMTGLAVSMTVGLRLVASGLLGLLGAMSKEKTSSIPTRGPFMAGQYGKESSGAFSLKMIGIADTERDFLTCVSEGVDVFFEFRGADALRVIREPQFYTIFTRNIIRSGNVIVNSIKDVFSQGQNPLQAAQALLGLVDVLKSSKIIAFLNIMAQLGDRSLEKQEQGFDANAKRVSSIEHLPDDNPAANIMKIRNSRSNLRSGMDQAASISRFLLPVELVNGAKATGATNVHKALSNLPEDHISSDFQILEEVRIAPETVSELESKLDSEYVPFYFHDLRTNEIVSFHAFLDSLDDTYTPRYEETSAYGRIDKIRTYVETERVLNFSFNIVSTSPEGFDLMWWKINKLTTLVYPSWTEGRHVTSGQDQFIQPFSQVPGSTPLIRVRIGDLVRSNYSKFDLMRLFGAGSSKCNLLETVQNKDGMYDFITLSKTRDRIMKNPAISGDDREGYPTDSTAYLLPNRNGYKLSPDDSLLKGKGRAAALASLALGGETKKRLVLTTTTKVKIEKRIIQAGYGEHKVAYYDVSVKDKASDLLGVYRVTHDDLMPDPDWVAENAPGYNQVDTDIFVAGNLPVPRDPTSGPVEGSGNFSPDNNVVVRSFQNVQGKGLAGVITTFGMSELVGQNITWETDFGARAPKVVKVNMSLAVVHDIAPGIDHNGYIRAIQYPVGKIAHKLNGDTYPNNAESTFNKNHLQLSSFLRNGNPKPK